MTPHQPERRATPRALCNFRATCRLNTNPPEQLWAAEACDLSTDGIGLLVNRRLPLGTNLTVRLVTLSGETAVTRGASVVHTEPHSTIPNMWVVGCAFQRPLAETIVRALIGG
jgi:PilZ domain